MRRFLLAVIAVSLLSAWAGADDIPPPGGRQWRFIAGGPIVGWPCADSRGRFYFTAEDRFLYALDNSGIMQWRTDLGRRSAGMTAVGPDGSIYVVLEDGRLLAINKDGRLIWEFSLAPEEPLPPVVLSTGMVVASERSGQVVGLTHTGFPIWSLSLGEALSAAPVPGYQGHLIFGTVRGNLFTVDQAGQVVASRYIGDVPSVIAPDRQGLLVGTASGRLIRIGYDGEPAWRSDLGSAAVELVLGSGSEAYVRLDDGSLAHVTPDGVISWRANPTPARITTVNAARGALVGLSGGSLAHIGTDGTLSWQLPLPSPPLLVALTRSASVVVSTSSWVTYSYSLELAPDGPWPFGRGTAAATGTPPGVTTARPPAAGYADVLDYIYLSSSLRSPFEDDQLAGLREIEERIHPRTAGRDPDRETTAGLAGSYPYILSLCEETAGAPYFGPVGFDGRTPVGRNARSLALSILGEIGDLTTAGYLLRLLRVEEAADLQVEILGALTKLRTGSSGDAVRVLAQVIESRSVRPGSDALAQAAVSFLEAVYEYEGGFLSADGVLILTRIMSGAYMQSTRDTAAETLRALANRN